MGLIARVLEDLGIPTVTISLFPEVTARAAPPRTIEVAFPFGAPFGDPGNAPLQMAVLRSCLDLLDEAKEPGTVVRPPLRWKVSPEG